jgi:hypothetical protein
MGTTFRIANPVEIQSPLTTTQAVRNDDTRLTNARTPTAHASTHSTGQSDPITPGNIGAAATSHTHAASDINSGVLANTRMPVVASVVRSVAISAGAVAIDASTQGNNIDITGTGNYTQNVPTNGTTGQVLNVTVWTTSATTVTFNASFVRLGAIASTLVIPISKFARYQLRCTNVSGTLTWIVEAAAVGQ